MTGIIRNPHKFNIKQEMDGQYYNLWSTDNDKTVPNDDVVIKSVYDPSPVGYSLPASNAFTGFTDTGLNTGNPGNPAIFNVKDNWDKGWYFYTKPNRKGNTIFFPYNRSRQYNGEFRGGRGDATTATPSTDKQHYLMTYGPTYIYPLDNYDYRSWGFSVRSAEEKKWRCVVWSYNVQTSAALHPPHARRGSPPFMMSWMTQSHIATPTTHKKINALKGTNSKKTVD